MKYLSDPNFETLLYRLDGGLDRLEGGQQRVTESILAKGMVDIYDTYEKVGRRNEEGS